MCMIKYMLDAFKFDVKELLSYAFWRAPVLKTQIMLELWPKLKRR